MKARFKGLFKGKQREGKEKGEEEPPTIPSEMSTDSINPPEMSARRRATVQHWVDGSPQDPETALKNIDAPATQPNSCTEGNDSSTSELLISIPARSGHPMTLPSEWRAALRLPEGVDLKDIGREPDHHARDCLRVLDKSSTCENVEKYEHVILEEYRACLVREAMRQGNDPQLRIEQAVIRLARDYREDRAPLLQTMLGAIMLERRASQ